MLKAFVLKLFNPMDKLSATCLCIALGFMLTRAFQFRAAVRHIKNHPGLRYVLQPDGLLALFFPWKIPYFSPGRRSVLFRRYEDFRVHNCDVITSISAWPTVTTQFWVGGPETMKTITSNRILYPKPLDVYRPLAIYGPNLVASEHDDWRRYRKVAAPGFSERNNRFVWAETIRVVEEMIKDDNWEIEESVTIEDTRAMTSAISLSVISAASFGRKMSWKESKGECLPGYKMSFREVIRKMSENGIVLKMIYPDWFLRIAPVKALRDVHTAFFELKSYMLDLIAQRRRAEPSDEKDDLFSNLIAANDDEVASQRLSDDELIGNVWILLIAGHETTGTVLLFSLTLLAIYQDEHKALYKQIRELLPEGEVPNYTDIGLYTRATAVLYETMRKYPSVQQVFKTAAEDTVLATHSNAGEPVDVAVPKGSTMVLSIMSAHCHPRYWEDPYTWKPERFLGDWPKEAFMPFSTGARSCIGRRFAEVEAIAVLIMIVSRYEVYLKEDMEYAYESLQEREERILGLKFDMFLKLKPIPLVFKKRY